MFSLIRHQGSVAQTHDETHLTHTRMIWVKKDGYGGFPGGPVVKNLPAKASGMSLIPGLGRFHMLQAHVSQLLSPQTLKPMSATREAAAIRSP